MTVPKKSVDKYTRIIPNISRRVWSIVYAVSPWIMIVQKRQPRGMKLFIEEVTNPVTSHILASMSTLDIQVEYWQTRWWSQCICTQPSNNYFHVRQGRHHTLSYNTMHQRHTHHHISTHSYHLLSHTFQILYLSRVKVDGLFQQEWWRVKYYKFCSMHYSHTSKTWSRYRWLSVDQHPV